jgi:hypothetical protein
MLFAEPIRNFFLGLSWIKTDAQAKIDVTQCLKKVKHKTAIQLRNRILVENRSQPRFYRPFVWRPHEYNDARLLIHCTKPGQTRRHYGAFAVSLLDAASLFAVATSGIFAPFFTLFLILAPIHKRPMITMPASTARNTTIASDALNVHVMNESVTVAAFWAEKMTAAATMSTAKKRITIRPPFVSNTITNYVKQQGNCYHKLHKDRQLMLF